MDSLLRVAVIVRITPSLCSFLQAELNRAGIDSVGGYALDAFSDWLKGLIGLLALDLGTSAATYYIRSTRSKRFPDRHESQNAGEYAEANK